ncbi:hypothetical protein N0V84_006512 [Fusarium piperis]|uniref:Yeast cell wall synthesis Kre9/Knh1-like N-terminal domain-containing protein n=1 Tax=Fusarium piperis TaxID=1435070 RepID=A0A9W8WBT9_9HYPO|nr:hypothetical protein N0V84_006512 [Fusarium piperis]
MKYTFATVAAFASVALATPAFLNSRWDVQEGRPFTIRYSGCEGGCTITLQNGESSNTQDVTVLTATAEGDSFTFTPNDLPSDTYNFKIQNNEDRTINYSEQFPYQGTGTRPSTTGETTAAETTSAEETSAPATTEATTLTTVSQSVSISTKEKTSTEEHTTIHTPIATKNATTPIPTTKKSTQTGEATSTEESETTAAETSAAATGSSTTVPESGAARMTSSLALIAGAVMAMVYLN